jgi:dTDP-4-amino-4,6-dideoxygalactose transaminase
MLAIRRRNATHLMQGLRNINSHYQETFQLPTVAEGNECAWMMFPIVIVRGDKESLISHLLAHGIECRDMLPILGQPAPHFKYLRESDYPVSANIVRNGLYVGCHQDITPEDCKFMIDVLGMWASPEYPGIME